MFAVANCLPPTAYGLLSTEYKTEGWETVGKIVWIRPEGMVLKQGSSVNVKFVAPGFQREMGKVVLLFAGFHRMMDHAI